MADRLTQLQDAVNQQADNFCNSTTQQQEDHAHLFATVIARCAKDIDVLIESLPSEDSSTEIQVASLRHLEQDNREAGEQLEDVVRRGEALLEQVQAALADIAKSQLDMQHLAADGTTDT
uniref:Mediator of RNA polymerase II transcription subunit 21 n=1 Tax=Timema poppense TaxID=170557 RepID=A0A7R9H9F3_TIMPO|nr:unnamed protein product [Timema poppensis]